MAASQAGGGWLLELPDEVLRQVFKLCSHHELCALAQVCVAWHRYLRTHQGVWRSMAAATWGPLGSRVRGAQRWDKVFRAQYEVEKRWRRGDASQRLLSRPPSKKRSTRVTGVALHGLTVLATASSDASVLQISLDDGEVVNTFVGHSKAVTGFDMAASELITASADKTVRVWDMTSGLVRSVFAPTRKPLTCVSAHGERVAGGTKDGLVHIWRRVERSAAQPEYSTHALSGPISSVLMASSRMVVAGTANGELSLYTCADALACPIRSFYTVPEEGAPVTTIRYSKYHARLVVGSGAGVVALYHPSSAEPESVLAAHSAKVVGLQCNALRLVTWSDDATVAIWDWRETRKPASVFSLDYPVTSAAFDDRHATLVIAGCGHAAIDVFDFRAASDSVDTAALLSANTLGDFT
ncbi:uncharacterized protein AMSG_04416 [Thecamonas trahens ATCC 50062]|uniref:F-box domain-containing protein n=1 Tax=Thecamonas trahens ATCC 50062 TaxID=461836 RepID=A0A0L0D735_THETB|nr:hypothetical protein AMSG_04416 [Thecamonas trahens ATCC 50062]KNC48187.1 hypothetical protein AMSG_04416 [Thecamonas trahens ATCC 50062]|eukprot:XP_013758756.1 hypothetical protein AMSG_04416 [Thecamonas trahens ATCC 50062]